jgi:hypothetical protein
MLRLEQILCIDSYPDVIKCGEKVYASVGNNIIEITNKPKVVLTCPGQIMGFSQAYPNLYVHYFLQGHYLASYNGHRLVTILTLKGKESSSTDTLTLWQGRLIWVVPNDHDDYDPDNSSSNQRSPYGKIWFVDPVNPSLQDMLGYGIRGCGGTTVTHDCLHFAHVGQNWNSLYRLDLNKRHQYLGYRTYDGPILTVKPYHDDKWIIMYPKTTNVEPVYPYLFYPKHTSLLDLNSSKMLHVVGERITGLAVLNDNVYFTDKHFFCNTHTIYGISNEGEDLYLSPNGQRSLYLTALGNDGTTLYFGITDDLEGEAYVCRLEVTDDSQSYEIVKRVLKISKPKKMPKHNDSFYSITNLERILRGKRPHRPRQEVALSDSKRVSRSHSHHHHHHHHRHRCKHNTD